MQTPRTYRFSVDAELLRELGERLVGRPSIALAELVKNSFDADATVVEITATPETITVADNGNGMSEREFHDRWMRVGTTRKRVEQRSPRFGRNLTGSKGVGRLSTQVLARTVRVTTGPIDAATVNRPAITASVDWDDAVRSGDLTSVQVHVTTSDAPVFPSSSRHGTVVELGRLVDEWTAADFAQLAREIWTLRPPFEISDGTGMSIELRTEDEDVAATFDRQMRAILDIWTARITGELLPPDVQARVDKRLPHRLDDDPESPNPGPAAGGPQGGPRADRLLRMVVELRDAPPAVLHYLVPESPLYDARYEIRVFNLRYRQPEGISVTDARAYLRQYGGVGIYDAQFRLPYYGVEQDWLNSERDHARRLDRSALVPEALQVRRGLLDLPPNSRLFGWVQVSTASEERAATTAGRSPQDALSIQVSRDRLTDNAAFQQLRVLVRAGLDVYAMETAREKLVKATQSKAKAPTRPDGPLDDLRASIDAAKAYVPATVYRDLDSDLRAVVASSAAAQESGAAYATLLGALATAGSSSLAYEHEVSKQVREIQDIADLLDDVAGTVEPSAATALSSVVARLHDWERRAAGIRSIFGPLLNTEDRSRVDRFLAKSVIRQTITDLKPLTPGMSTDLTEVPADLRLPAASMPAWTSILQNVILNAFNAMLFTDHPRLHVAGQQSKGRSTLQLSDNGVGVDLDEAAELWKPFERRLVLPVEREEAGLGGLGLGLTIVRMIGDEIDLAIDFVPPRPGYSTTLQMDWKQ